MSLFNWFLGKPGASKNVLPDSGRLQRGHMSGNAVDPSPKPADKPTPGPEEQASERRVKRHARREQLYVAVRESMLRAGVLSSSYKFRVLSLDQQGDQFLVMADVAPGLGDQANKLTEIETLMINTARSLFSIYVTSVYWRTDNRSAAANAVNFGVSPPVDRGAQRFEPIHEGEMAAFKQSAAVPSAHHPATLDRARKPRSGFRSATLLTGFEDTEMPEQPATPALSATQYGELR